MVAVRAAARQPAFDLAGPVLPAAEALAAGGSDPLVDFGPEPRPGLSVSHSRDAAEDTAETAPPPVAAEPATSVGNVCEQGIREQGQEGEGPARIEPVPAEGRGKESPASPADRWATPDRPAVHAPLAAPVPDLPPGLTLDDALKEVAEAARAWGIEAHDREGRFISAMMVTIRTLGQVSELSRAELRDISQRHLEAVKVERDKARELARATEAALGQARSAVIVAEVERDQVVATMVEKTLPLFAKHMREVMVIRERAWNIDRRRRRDALAALVGVGLFLAGAGACAWWFEVEIGFAQSCPRHAFASQGHVFCNMDALVAAHSQ